jgi:predicted phosphodiesterase
MLRQIRGIAFYGSFALIKRLGMSSASSRHSVQPRQTKAIQGKHLFTFALIADTHLRSPHDAPSPWKTNALAHTRTKLVLEQVTDSKPKFVVHLGDVTNPVPHLTTYDSACDVAKDLIQKTGLKTYIVAGNHDVGDKVSLITPNHPIDDYSLRKFESTYGPSYQSFDIQSLHLVIINSSLFGSELPQDQEQLDWLEHDLAANRGKRIFMFSHYPIFMTEPMEPALYDNIEVEGRTRILELLREFNVEAAFAGHVHNFFYNRYHDTEMYGLLSTTFVRQDYSEMFNASPGGEFGRDDTPKIGWAEVKVYEQGHVVHVQRALDPIRELVPITSVPVNFESYPKYYSRRGLGTHLREAWAEARPLPYSGPTDEFERRRARNDYALLALWECGLRDVRVPLRDLLEADYRARMTALADMGQRFTVFHAGLPKGELLDLLIQNNSAVTSVEIVLPWQDIEGSISDLGTFVRNCELPVYVACVSSPMDHRQKSYQFGYFMSFGFDYTELDMLQKFHQEIGKDLGLGYTFRIGPEQSPLVHGLKISEFAAKLSAPVMFNVSSQTAIPELRFDDVAIATRSAEAAMLAASSELLTVFIDTLVDVHRGYTPRSALYDGRYNPRLAGRVVANLQSILRAGAKRPQILSVSGEQVLECEFVHNEVRGTLIMPKSEGAADTFFAAIGALATAEKSFVGLSRLADEDLSKGAEALAKSARLEPVLLIHSKGLAKLQVQNHK